MISFKTFITEARMAPLYHATSLEGFEGILKDNLLKATKDGRGLRTNKPTNFFTRNLKNAAEYGDMVHSRPFLIFQVDQLKLNTRYKLQPLHNWSRTYYNTHRKPTHKGALVRGEFYGTEFEEIVDGDVKNFLSYVTKIYTVNGSYSIDKIYEYLNSAAMANLEKYNLKIEELPNR